jgi:oxygen-dependent protoporphyrinogen oxidase
VSESNSPKRVVVIGSGITGLAASYRLLDEARKRNLTLDLSLLEATEHFGGVIETSQEAGCLMEHGPDCFLSLKPAGLELCKELGLKKSLMGTNEECRKSYVLRGSSLLPVPRGFYMLAPSSIQSFLTTPIFSMSGKIRIMLDLLIPRRREEGDETLASFVRRRLGREALERMAQPMVAGIYSADPEKLSLNATFPQFLEMERKHRSLILALRKRMQTGNAEGAASGPRYGLFVTLREGMEQVVDALLERIPQDSLRGRCRVTSLRKEANRWRVGTEGDGELEADAVCLTLPAHQAAELMRDEAPEMAASLDGISYGSLGTLNLVFRREQVKHPLDGMGFVVPEVEGRSLLACSFSSTKFPGRAPEGKVLLRAFFSGSETDGLLSLSDDAVIDRIAGELRDILDIEGNPEAAILRRYPQAMPQYTLGHLDRVKTIEAEAERLPGFAIGGNAYRGVGMPDCVAGANQAAERILEQLFPS